MTEKNNQVQIVRRVSLHYAAAFFVYFAAFCMIRSFISLYLLDCGFSYTQVGGITGIHMMVTALVQPYYSDILDRFPKLGLRRFVSLCCIPSILCSLLTFALPAKPVLFILIYIVFGVCEIGMQSLMVSIGMEYVNAGLPINAGFGRGAGSVGYAAANLLLGFLIVKFGSPVSHVLNIGLSILLIFTLMTLPDPETVRTKEVSEAEKNEGHSDNLIDFLRNNPVFALFIFSCVCIFFAHSIVSTYMPNVAGQFGMGADFTGLLNSLAAFLELLPMVFFAQLSKRISPMKLLYISAVFFSLKILTAALAQNPAVLILSQIMQIAAYAVFAIASIYFANQAVRPRNRVMAQGLLIGALETGFTIGSLVGGIVLDHADIRTLLWMGVGVSFIGSVLMILSVKRFEEAGLR